MNDPKKPGLGAATLEKQTIVEEGTRLKGSLTSKCPVVVQGAIDGEIDGPSITVSRTGSVSGKIAAGALKSEGRVAGELDVDTAHLAGSVDHDTVIRASSIDLKLTAQSGKLELTFGGPRPNRLS